MASPEHELYLRDRTFRPACSLRFLDESEQQDLRRYGAWLQALAQGEIEPESESQQQFLDLIQRDERPDATAGKGAYFADLWWRYQRRIEWEQEGS